MSRLEEEGHLQGTGGGAACALDAFAPDTNLDAERIGVLKARVAELHVRDATLSNSVKRTTGKREVVLKRAQGQCDHDVQQASARRDAEIKRSKAEHSMTIDGANEDTEAAIQRAKAEYVAAVQNALVQRKRATAQCDAELERERAELRAVRTEMASASREIDELVNAPVSGGRDPTQWLPDEIVVMIMMMLPGKMLWVCARVCPRWARLVESARAVKLSKRGALRYASGLIEPMALEGHRDTVRALAVGRNGKVYSGSVDNTIRVWSGDDGTHLQTLVGHTRGVYALAVGLDGKVYSGSWDMTIRVWSGEDGRSLKILKGHLSEVTTLLAVGLGNKVYSGSGADGTIRVWSGDDGTHLQTLCDLDGSRYGVDYYVSALAVGLDGKVFSGSMRGTIRVWSGEDGTLLRTVRGHWEGVTALAVGPDGRVYSGSKDSTIGVWSGTDGAHIQTLDRRRGTRHRPVTALAVGMDGNVYIGSCDDATIVVLQGVDGALTPAHVLRGRPNHVFALALTNDGRLVSGGCLRQTTAGVHKDRGVVELW
jgi:hypothetical protein